MSTRDERLKNVALENQKLRSLFNEIRDISEERDKFEIIDLHNIVRLRYNFGKFAYILVCFNYRGSSGEPTIIFKTSSLDFTTKKWLPLFGQKTTSQKVLNIILKIKDEICRKQKAKENQTKEQNELIKKIKKDLGINNTFKINTRTLPGYSFQKFELESISNNCELILEPTYANKYTIKFKIENVQNTNLENVVSDLLKLELM